MHPTKEYDTLQECPRRRNRSPAEDDSCRHWCFFVWHVRHDIQLECGTTLVLFIIIVNYSLKNAHCHVDGVKVIAKNWVAEFFSQKAQTRNWWAWCDSFKKRRQKKCNVC